MLNFFFLNPVWCVVRIFVELIISIFYKMKKKLFKNVTASLLMLSTSMFSQVNWNFNTAAPTASTVPANVAVSSMTIGNSLGTATMIASGVASSGYTGASGGNNAGNASRTGALNKNASGSAYFQFTVTPSQDYYVSLNGISFGTRSTGTGPAAYTLFSNLDNYGSSIATGTMLANSAWSLRSNTGFTITSGVSTPIVFRLFGHSGSGSPGSNVSNWRIDDLTLTLSTTTVCGSPNAYSVTGTGGYCPGGTGVAVGLSNSDIGVSYQLKNGASNVGSAILGTGSTISFGNQLAGTYSVVATSTIGTCTSNMLGNAIVTENALPTISIVGSNSICSGFSTTLTANGADTYTWSTNSSATTISVSPLSTTNYTLTGTDNNGCVNTAVKTLSVNNCGSNVTSLYYCNIAITNINYPAYAIAVPGATQYKFNFYDPTGTTLIATKTTTSNLLMLNTVSGINYTGVYKWKVQVNTGSGFGPESIGNCTLTINPPVITMPCNYTCTSMSTPVLAQAGNVYPIEYRFTFYNSNTNALVATRTQPSNYLYLYNVSGLSYNTTYKYTVEAKYFNGTAQVFTAPSSSLCTITIAEPKTTLPCGLTTNTNAYTTVPWVAGVSAYRVNLYNTTTNALVATKTFTNSYIYFNQIPGLVNNNSYYWTVECQYNNGSSNVFAAPSSTNCTVTFGTPSTIVLNSSNSNNTMKTINIDAVNVSNEVEMNVYPNPSQGLVNVELNELDTNTDLTITNAIGQEVYKTNITVKNNQINIGYLPAGIYYIKYANFTKKLIKE